MWLRGQFHDRRAYVQPGSNQPTSTIWLTCGKLGEENVDMGVYTSLGLFAAPGTPAASSFNGRMSTRNRDPQIGLHMAELWLNWCKNGIGTTGHKRCNANVRDEMPTRVIDIGSKADGPNSARLITTNGLREPYFALSYCWGPSATKHLMLTRENLSSLTHSIPEDELSGAHKDMFRIAGELDVRYVWIDALCIIQGDAEDWECESRRMGQVYGNAFMTVVAGRSGDSSQGFIENSLVQKVPPCPLPLDEGRNGVDTSGLFACLPRSKAMGPVSERAWCFQEMHLSRRSLVFGAEQLFFRCREHYYYEDGVGRMSEALVVGATITTGPSADTIVQRTGMPGPPLDRRGQVLFEWYVLVMEYTMRQLSNPYDIFAALTSMAQLAGQALESRYLAGIWEADLVRGLLWKSRHQVIGGGFDPNGRRWSPVKRPEPINLAPGLVRRAPSWSWAAVQGPTVHIYRMKNRFKADKVVVRPKYTDPDRWTSDQGYNADVLHMPSCELQIIGCLKAVKVLKSKQVVDYRPCSMRWPAYNAVLMRRNGVLLEPMGGETSSQVGANPADPLSGVVAIGVFDIAQEQVPHLWCLRLVEDEGLMLVPVGEGRYARAGWFTTVTEENRKWFQQDNDEAEVLLV